MMTNQILSRSGKMAGRLDIVDPLPGVHKVAGVYTSSSEKFFHSSTQCVLIAIGSLLPIPFINHDRIDEPWRALLRR